MKQKHRIILFTAAAPLVTFAVFAQETPRFQRPMNVRITAAVRGADVPREKSDSVRSATDSSRQSSPTMTHGARMGKLGGATKASELIGLTVKNLQGDKLGKVEDIAVDVQSGRVVYVVLSTGGFVGMGDSLHAVPPGALHHDVANKVVHLDADKEKLKAAPKFEMSKWREFSDSDHVMAIYRHYGAEPDFTVAMAGEDRTAMPARSRDGTQEKDRMMRETDATHARSRVSYVQRASKVMGLAVKNRQDEKLGKVENLMVDLPAGRVVAVIISSGGFLGMGDELSAVPPTALRLNDKRDVLELDVSKETLGNAPHFKSNEWPNLGEAAYTESVYRAYKAEPYFMTSSGSSEYSENGPPTGTTTRMRSDADNTARNVRDRNNNSLTPLDQGNNKADVDVTARIRKDIIAAKGMSMNARNVKVITANGRVTLRGPVGTEEEKRLIGEIANNAARMENVDNQLEVKTTSSDSR